MNDIPILTYETLLGHLPKRQASAHKGNFGHVLVVGGDLGYPGAPVLAALGALRVGAGLVTLATRREHLYGLNSVHPEIMWRAIDEPHELLHLFEKTSVAVVGPGLGRSEWSRTVYGLVSQTNLPLVVDADALFFLAQAPHSKEQRVLTPHPGEAATLLHQSKPIDTAQRADAVSQLIAKYASTIVLKGSGTLIGSKNSSLEQCTHGNPGMASGGMGDLLSGVIAGLIAQGLKLDVAAKLGVCVHAMAGDIAAKTGQRGTIASDLLLPIKQLMQ